MMEKEKSTFYPSLTHNANKIRSVSSTSTMSDDELEEDNSFFEGEIITPRMIYEQRDKLMQMEEATAVVAVADNNKNEVERSSRTDEGAATVERIDVERDIEAPSTVNNNNAAEQAIEATVVDENDDVERVRKVLVKEKEMLRQQMAAEANQLRKRVSDLQEQQQGKKRSMVISCFVVLVIVIGAITGAWWWISNNGLSFSSKSQESSPSSSSPTNPPTGAGTTAPSPRVTEAPVPSPTSCPSAAPNFLNGVYFSQVGGYNVQYEMYCMASRNTDLVVLMKDSTSCELQCLGSITSSAYNKVCSGTGDDEGEDDFYFVLRGDYQQKTVLIGYLNEDVTLQDCKNDTLLQQ